MQHTIGQFVAIFKFWSGQFLRILFSFSYLVTLLSSASFRSYTFEFQKVEGIALAIKCNQAGYTQLHFKLHFEVAII